VDQRLHDPRYLSLRTSNTVTPEGASTSSIRDLSHLESRARDVPSCRHPAPEDARRSSPEILHPASFDLARPKGPKARKKRRKLDRSRSRSDLSQRPPTTRPQTFLTRRTRRPKTTRPADVNGPTPRRRSPLRDVRRSTPRLDPRHRRPEGRPSLRSEVAATNVPKNTREATPRLFSPPVRRPATIRVLKRTCVTPKPQRTEGPRLLRPLPLAPKSSVELRR
jgi:hypothetical protein